MRRALVTGATGLVGSYIVERLHADGWQVRALARDARRAAWIESLGAELFVGDVVDARALVHASAACDAIRQGSCDGWRFWGRV